jgi:hypothetical protein
MELLYINVGAVASDCGTLEDELLKNMFAAVHLINAKVEILIGCGIVLTSTVPIQSTQVK